MNEKGPKSNTEIGAVLDAANALAKRILSAEQSAEKANYRADHDPLTGLLNKTAWKTELTSRIEQSNPGELAILFIDLKDFKLANDKKGHGYGDKILTRTANILLENLRSRKENTDTLGFEPENEREKAGRYGGDEFVVILDLAPRENSELTPQERIDIVKERITSSFNNEKLVQDSGVGITIGSAILQENQTTGELIQEADQSMYAEKDRQRQEQGSYR